MSSRPVIYYGVACEGLGHATRALALHEQLKEDFDIFFFSTGAALKCLQDNCLPAEEIPGLAFRYTNNKISFTKSAASGCSFVANLGATVQRVLDTCCKCHKPDLVIADFEPVMPRVAKKLGVPLISVDNQHRFSRCKHPEIPMKLKAYAASAGLFTELLVPNPEMAIISCFHVGWLDDNVKKRYAKNTHCVGGFFRSSVTEQEPWDTGFILAYTRPSIEKAVFQYLLHSKVPSIMYAHGQTQEQFVENVQIKPVGPSFSEDLAKCNGVISTAGNQLLAEMCYQGKPSILLPEPNQWEQDINARIAEQMTIAKRCTPEDLLKDTSFKLMLHFFNQQHSSFTPHVHPNGAKKAAHLIREFLNVR